MGTRGGCAGRRGVRVVPAGGWGGGAAAWRRGGGRVVAESVCAPLWGAAGGRW
ncbi:hypothetical protein HGQ98_34715 [Achromobacter ruhlandii]|uniref:Uncharacterized protein n=1 Tax=Achromobacter ruhlandii TaxID=72557 RepID=A0A848NT29_9BURK|nr:hypothetical protein [Achromobacter ruhlandii]